MKKLKKRNSYEGNETVSVRLPPEIIFPLEAEAKRLETTRSAIIRELVRDWLGVEINTAPDLSQPRAS